MIRWPNPLSALLLALLLAPGLGRAADQPATNQLASSSGQQRQCLRLLVLTSQQQAQNLAERARGGEAFAALARQLGGEALAGARMRCLETSELDGQVQAALQELRPGQVSQPLPLAGKWVLVQLNSDEYWRRGEELQRAGRYQEAEESLLRDAALNPDGPAWRLIAKTRAAAKDQPGALKALDQALVWAPEDVALLNEKASLLLGMGRRDEAMAHFEKALALQPDNAILLNNLAWIMVRQGHNLERAETLARRATQKEPGRASYWDTLGLAQQARGNPAGAAVSYHQALRLDPELAPAKANLLKSLLVMDGATLARALDIQGPTPTPAAPSAQPAKSAKLAKLVEPAKPAKAGKLVKPAKPAKATKSAKSAKPAKPAKPAKAAKAAKAAKPAPTTSAAKLP